MRTLLIAIIAITFAQCATTKNSTTSPNIPADIKGNFKDDYDIAYTINDSVWIQHPNIKYHIISYNSQAQCFLVRNDAKNPTEAGLYSRIDIMRFQNMEPFRWGFCLTKYDARSEKEALNAASADRSNPKKGCGGYPFSRMKRH